MRQQVNIHLIEDVLPGLSLDLNVVELVRFWLWEEIWEEQRARLRFSEALWASLEVSMT